VISEKGFPTLYQMTSGEEGETISVIACCNTDGYFIPPACIFKRKNKRQEQEDSLGNGSKVITKEKSSYINSSIFMLWVKDNFIPRNPTGKVVLDCYTSLA
jgi:hypothetical protein